MRRSKFVEEQEQRGLLSAMLGPVRAEAPDHQQWQLSAQWNLPPPPLLDAGGKEIAELKQGGRREILRLEGHLLFDDASLDDALEAEILELLPIAYARCELEKRRVSQLAVRRRYDPFRFNVPELGPDSGVRLVDANASQILARLTVPIIGDASYLKRWSSSEEEASNPIGRVLGKSLVLAATCNRAGLPFVAEYLRNELALVRRRLEEQRQHARKLEKAYPAIVKQIVAEEWLKLSTGLRRNRRKGPVP